MREAATNSSYWRFQELRFAGHSNLIFFGNDHIDLIRNDLTVATPTYPTKLDGLELLLNRSPLPMQAVTPWQINAQIPQNATPGDSGSRAVAARRALKGV